MDGEIKMWLNNCACGFKFSEPGEFRNCNAFITGDGEGGIICPVCDNAYVNGWFVGKYKEMLKKEGV